MAEFALTPSVLEICQRNVLYEKRCPLLFRDGFFEGGMEESIGEYKLILGGAEVDFME